MVFERKILKKTFRPVNYKEAKGVLRKGKNNQLGRLFKKKIYVGHNQEPKITVG